MATDCSSVSQLDVCRKPPQSSFHTAPRPLKITWLVTGTRYIVLNRGTKEWMILEVKNSCICFDPISSPLWFFTFRAQQEANTTLPRCWIYPFLLSRAPLQLVLWPRFCPPDLAPQAGGPVGLKVGPRVRRAGKRVPVSLSLCVHLSLSLFIALPLSLLSLIISLSLFLL